LALQVRLRVLVLNYQNQVRLCARYLMFIVLLCVGGGILDLFVVLVAFGGGGVVSFLCLIHSHQTYSLAFCINFAMNVIII
ncbi:hypothetical protein T12_6432, partial [Trichinella patagoniensis]